MSWNQFSYICRKAHATFDSSQQNIAAHIDNIKHEQNCRLYGKNIQPNTWSAKILNIIANQKDPKKAQEILKTYSNLRLDNRLEQPMQFKRVMAYLTYISLIFFILATIYQLKVIPTFVETMDSFSLDTANYLSFYRHFGVYIVTLVFLSLLGALFLGFHLKKFFHLSPNIEKGFISRFFVLQSVINSHNKIVEALVFPIRDSLEDTIPSTSKINEHLRDIDQEGMCIATEMQAIINHEIIVLTEKCEKQMKVLYTIIAIVIVLTISEFISSAYAPIFILGDYI